MAGVSRVVVGCRDPNPRVDGGGIKQLQDSGLYVSLLGHFEKTPLNIYSFFFSWNVYFCFLFFHISFNFNFYFCFSFI